jgi:hypothetical protein
VLASALLAQRAVADAQSAAAEAHRALARSPHRALRLSLSITDARGRAAAGRREEALSMLAGVLGEARQLEMVELQLEARLAGLEIQAPRAALDDERRALAADARALGFGLIARKAEAGQR